MTSVRFVLLFAALASHLFGQSSDTDEARIIQWPDTVVSKFNLEAEEIYEDGIEYRYRLISSNIEFVMENRADWKLGKGNRSKSLVLQSTKDSRLTFEITEFMEKQLLDDLGIEDWEAYKRGVLQRYPSAQIIEDRHSSESNDPPFPFSKPCRNFAYEIALPGKDPVVTREIFFFLGEHLYVFAFSGPKNLIQQAWHRHNMIITRMNIAKS